MGVRRRRCECGLRSPSFGPVGGKRKDARWCATCRPEGAVNVVHKKCECGATKPAFAAAGEKERKAAR